MYDCSAPSAQTSTEVCRTSLYLFVHATGRKRRLGGRTCAAVDAVAGPTTAVVAPQLVHVSTEVAAHGQRITDTSRPRVDHRRRVRATDCYNARQRCNTFLSITTNFLVTDCKKFRINWHVLFCSCLGRRVPRTLDANCTGCRSHNELSSK